MARLITTLEELKEYVGVNNGLSMESVKPGLNEVELQTLDYYFGPLLSVIITEHEATVFSDRITAIYPYVRQALANLGVYNSMTEIEIQITDSGITRLESENEKTAFGGQVVRMKDTIGNRGYAAIDKALLIIANDVANYPEWLTSEYYLTGQGLIFTSASDFSKYENIKNSSLTFLAMATYIDDNLESIAAAMPDEMFNDMISVTPSEENQLLLTKYIKPALAKMAMNQALMYMPVDVDHLGVTVNQLELQSTDNRSKKTAPNMYIERKMSGLMKSANAYLAKMTDFLNTNASATAYVDWFNSDFYEKSLALKIEEAKIIDEERKVYRA